jgi:hypothetical protein
MGVKEGCSHVWHVLIKTNSPMNVLMNLRRFGRNDGKQNIEATTHATPSTKTFERKQPQNILPKMNEA